MCVAVSVCVVLSSFYGYWTCLFGSHARSLSSPPPPPLRCFSFVCICIPRVTFLCECVRFVLACVACDLLLFLCVCVPGWCFSKSGQYVGFGFLVNCLSSCFEFFLFCNIFPFVLPVCLCLSGLMVHLLVYSICSSLFFS